ncbi:MAG: lipid A export permease/ATP-binding protein MsbA [Pseudomonadota bacterium]
MSEKITLKTDSKLYLRLLDYIRQYWVAFVIALLANVSYAGVDAGFTYLLKPILNKGFIARDLQFIHFLPFLILGAFLLRGISNIAGNYFIEFVSRGVVMRFRQDLFAHLIKLPAFYYDNTSSGKILSVLLYNVEQVANAGADAITTLVQSGFMIIGLLAVMFMMNWQLSLLYLILMPVIAITVRLSTKRLRRISLSLQTQMGEVTTIAEEAVEGYKVVRMFGGQNYEICKFDRAVRRNRWRELKDTLTKAFTVSGIQLLAALVIAFTVYFVTSGSFSGIMTAGSFASLIAAMLALLKPLKDFTKVNATIQKGLAGAQSIFELLDQSVEEDKGTKVFSRMRGEITFDRVTFAYPLTEKVILKNINFKTQPGQCIALVGRSGGGKTTLISLLQRFYNVEHGSIAIDGVDIRDIKLESLRQQFALVSQNVTLFNDTVAHNIAYGRFAEAAESEIITAAKAANAWEFIEQLPNGLNTVIGENGVLLSGGQRQRIAIARAILKNAPILILDEATSSLDTESEREIQTALDQLIKNRTTIVIAHRLSTIENADMILVIDHGELVESGTHTALLALNGQYAKLHKMQFKAHV